ncbi:MAG: hypothetical protein A3H96_00520 [Acidobacteria bacterium RIFCSPLOWO2_02_FULL_67_36]|nr:MAG: hypothetical protein A3H96_00520 [Acidobacteria bacterium RIFCSPLOWO2_02_FULL_67_36]OFW23101.1 MAG: hypothetical protein A3G21_00830 [Acidobacteria bacterium RIFCSPLOWO2_12_FULL_66_21]
MKRFLPNENETPIVIAEIGGNHGGNLALAQQMVIEAISAGTRHVKFQTIVPERLVSSLDPDFEGFSKETLSFEEFEELSRFCRENGAVFLSTPFDAGSADFLERLQVPAFKIASGDLTYLPFIKHIASKNLPILLSTGASEFVDIDRAVHLVRGITDAELILMHCTAAYPCPDEEANLLLIPELRRRYQCPVGFSDHTLNVDIALAAAALGAAVIEKHFTVDRNLPGGDNALSVVPDELRALCRGVSRIGRALGSGVRKKTVSELKIDCRMHRSLVARRFMKASETLAADDIDGLRPAGGISPVETDRLIGKTLRVDVSKGEKFLPEHFL